MSYTEFTKFFVLYQFIVFVFPCVMCLVSFFDMGVNGFSCALLAGTASFLDRILGVMWFRLVL